MKTEVKGQKLPHHLCVYVCAAPAPVIDLHIQHSDETSLSAMWSHAPSGWRDGYILTLLHGKSVCHSFHWSSTLTSPS